MTHRTRALFGFVFGLIYMIACVSVFIVNDFDFINMQRGVRLIWQGINPWAPEIAISHFYNPPFAILFLWPMLFTTPKIIVVVGGACLFAFAFYQRAWTALAWFATNSFLYLIAAGGIDMLVMGGGVLLLTLGDEHFDRKSGLLLRVLGYGLLLVKPQGTIFIVAIYILAKKDWKGALVSILVYGLPFLRLFPSWVDVLLHNPPLAQTIAAHTLIKKFGWIVATLVGVLALLCRRWRFWEIGAALAQIFSPYGMPAAPIFMVYTAIPNLVAIPIIVLFSGGLAAMTWVAPPPSLGNMYDFINPLLSIYHLAMFGLALSLACLSKPTQVEADTEVDIPAFLHKYLSKNLSKNQKWPYNIKYG